MATRSSGSVTPPLCSNGMTASPPLTKFTMKRAKPSNSSNSNSKAKLREVRSRADLLDLQRSMASAIFRPLTPAWRMQSRLPDGNNMRAAASEFIKPNDRLSSFERLEIYNRQYWFRLLDCLYEDYPGLLAVLGEKRFLRVRQGVSCALSVGFFRPARPRFTAGAIPSRRTAVERPAPGSRPGYGSL